MSDLPQIQVHRISYSSIPTSTRFPFRYGIATMTNVPHLFVHSELEVDGRPVSGVASEGLLPKWFTKNADTSFEEDDLPNMQRVIRQAAQFARGIGEPVSFFEFWQTLKQRQTSWAISESVPPLLAQFGVAMMERTVLDGLCRALNSPLHQLVRENRLGIRLEEIHPELQGTELAAVYNRPPRDHVIARHTVGLGDPLTDAEIPAADRANDGLPHSLLANMQAYGLTHFKLKLSGNLDADRDRLRGVTTLLEAEAPADYRVTIDGNEQYADIEHFYEHFSTHQADRLIAPLFKHLLFVEQPIHRDFALSDSVRKGFAQWTAAPSVIIDESDSGVDCLPRALELGYRGTSHKNCKGIVKSLANRVLIDRRQGVMSAEDLVNLGPVALLQDLAMVSLLGIEHVERNGHHYFAGLSMFPESIQSDVLQRHPDLYQHSRQGFAALQIDGGRIATGSINAAPFGVGLDCQDFTADRLGGL